MIRNFYGYKTYKHAVFAGFFAGVYLGSRLFLFCGTRQGPFCPDGIHSLFAMMANDEHSYALLDLTTMSLCLLCGMDFMDAVPFHVTDMARSPPMGTGELHFKLSFVIDFNMARTVFNDLNMANFINADLEQEYIDISSTETDTDAGNNARDQGAAHGPPQWPTRTVSFEVAKPF